MGFIYASLFSFPPDPESIGIPQVYNKLLLNGLVDVNLNRIINVGEPVNALDVVNKQYADKLVSYNTSIYSPYAVSLSGIICKILHINNSNIYQLRGSIMNNLITNLGGST